MTFFYDLNKRLKDVLDTPKSVHQNLNEGVVAELSDKKLAAYQAKADKQIASGQNVGKRTAGLLRTSHSARRNKGLDPYADTANLKNYPLGEEGMSRAAKGYEKYGKEGMEALAKAGREGKALEPIRKKYDKYDESVEEGSTGDYSAKKARAGKDIGKPGKNFEKIAKSAGERYGSKERGEKVAGAVLAKLRGKNESVEEGLGDVVKKVGSMAKKVGSKALDTLGHGSDEDMIRDLQKKAGVPQTGKKPQTIAFHKSNTVDDNAVTAKVKEEGKPMSAKQKSFAALAEPKDKITFADKIAGAKKEVDEMLGDVAAKAMKSAVRGRQETDEGWDDMLKDVERRSGQMKTGEKVKGHKGEIEKTATGIKHTRSYDAKTGETDTGDGEGQAVKRGRGRPKKSDAPRQERITAKSRKADRTAWSKKTNEGSDDPAEKGEYDREGDMALDDIDTIQSAAQELQSIIDADENLPEWVQSKINKAMDYLDTARDYMSAQDNDEEPVNEKAVSKKQQKFMGMVHAAQKGEKPASKEVAKVAKEMPKKAAKDFAATKHEGLPEKKKPEGKKKQKTEEAGGTSTPTASSGFSFGKGIYDSINRELEGMISESMNVSMNMSNDPHGGPSKSLTVTATDEDAEYLGKLLKMAGLGGSEGGCGCGSEPCSCDQMDEAYGDTTPTENAPDYPTNTETSDDALQYAGGLNKPKSTGQTTVPVIASQEERQESYAEAEEDSIRRMMEMAGIDRSNRLDEGIMDKLKGFIVPKLLKLLGPDAESMANAVRQATGGDLTPNKENAMKVVKALGIDKAAAQDQSQMAEGIAGNWQGKLIQALYTLGLLGSAGAAASMWGTVGGNYAGIIGFLLLLAANAVFGDAPGQTGAMGKFGNTGTSTQRGLDDHGMPVRNLNVKESDELSRMMEMAGVKKKEVEEEKTEEGNLFTGNLAKARAAGKKEADLDGDGDLEKVRESVNSMWTEYKGKYGV